MKPGVLIVDDEEHILRSLQRSLRRDGYEVHLANSGPKALEILAQHEIAVVICDQRMPGMSGAEVLAEVYKTRPDTVRITLTGYTDLTAAQASINEGHVSHFLLKPWDDEHLRAVVRDGVRAYALTQENRRLQELTERQKEELEAWNKDLEVQVQQRTAELRTQNDRLATLQRRIEQSLRDTVGVLVGVLEASDPNIGLRSKRVTDFAKALGTRLNLPLEEQRDLEFAARLHDIGRISKRHHQIRRAGSRPANPTTRGHRHADSGYAILSHVSGFSAIAHGVRHQHEHYDGSGHPDGLKEDCIPLISRIIAIASAYEEAVYVSTDPTRPLHDAGIKALAEGRGRALDPDLVELFLAYLNEVGVEVCTDAEVELSPGQLRPGMRLSRALQNADGVLLVKHGTELSKELVERIQAWNNMDPLLNSVFVVCATGEGATVPTPGNDASRDHSDELRSAGRADRPEPVSRHRPSEDGGAHARVDPPRSSEPSSPPQAETPSRTDRHRVLVVDDEALLCNALKRELRKGGYDAVTTNSGHGALGHVEAERFDAVITDLAMPRMSGTELIEQLGERCRDLPCIILTGNARKEEILKLARAPNVTGVLVKPWNTERLMDALAASIARNRESTAV